MSELKHSELLALLIEESKKVGEVRNPPFTAERFLVAIIDCLLNTEEDPSIEMMILSSMMKRSFGDMYVAKQAMLQYIAEKKSASFIDDLYMKKTLQAAAEVTAKAGKTEISPMTLLQCIIKEPSNAIKPILIKPATNDEDAAADQSDEETTQENEPSFDVLLDEAVKAQNDELAARKDRKERYENSVKEDMAELVADVKRIRNQLQSAVFGQDNAINIFTTGYFQANLLSMIDKTRTRPRATFLFAGPPGVGKTFLAEKAAEALQLPFRRFDMSEYSDKEANIEFCGSDKVYKNAKAGNVTSFVAEHPKCVVLFDEIEKANIKVIHLFLQMLDAGRLRDNYTDNEVSFKDAIIILTTNAGRPLYEESESGNFSAVPRKVIIKALQKDVNPENGAPFFPGAICSRFASGNVVMFNHMGAHYLRTIAKKEIERHAANLQNETGIQLQIDERVYTALLFAEGSAADARTIRSRAETFFNDELYELLRLVASEKVKTNVETIEKIRVTLDLTRANSEVKALFASAERTKVLIFANAKTAALCKSKAPGFEAIAVQKVQDAIDAVKDQGIDFVLLDMKCGAPAASLSNLNLEDVQSPARSFFKFLKEQKADLPVYLIEDRKAMLDEEEKISFLRQGIRGSLVLAQSKDAFAKQLELIAESLYQQASMVKLAKANKLISFETAQTVSKNGKTATIKLFDCELSTAVDAQDAKNVLSSVSTPNVHFDDVIGAGDAKKELKYFVEYLKDPKKYAGTGVKAPKGVILYGPPGTGKTMLAKAMACEAGVTFIAAEGNEFLKRYVGEGAERVHELFKTARKYAPSILFIDEIDAIAKERKGGSNAGANGEETLTAFLTEMDGFVSDPSKPVFVLAATNFNVEPGTDKSLDPALMRRFDRRVYIDLPDKADRIRFLKMKIEKNQALQISETQIENLAVRSTGMSLAELDSVVELALRSAIRDGSTTVTDAILAEAFETFNSGEVKVWDVSQLERVARHEAGHAFLCWQGGETPTYLTVVARGNHGGYMQHADQEGKAIFTKEELLKRIRTSLGGRAAEIVYYGQHDGISTGASGDLMSATNMAQRILCAYGMDEEFGLAVVSGNVAGNGSMSIEVRAAVNRILSEQMKVAIQLISENKDKIDALVKVLMEKNHLNGAQINEVLTKGGLED
ncbi:MAG: AAA family ATPase [Ruminococcaceae bacterium]|nr:AAA family ATPase [Oscillospiraceae bacterium]